MADYFVWLDFETTGLDPLSLTVLEMGWTVTDDRLRQLTPLRSRFVALTFRGRAPVLPVSGGWSGGLDPIVVEMHESSGLHAEWLACPRGELVTASSGIDELLLGDLRKAGFVDWDEDRAFLAGAGVSHFDASVLSALDCKIVDELHYRAADVSCALLTLGFPAVRSVDALAALCERVAAGDSELLASLSDVTAERRAQGSSGPPAGPLGGLRGHRAADDVAFALVVARCLRRLVARGDGLSSILKDM